LTKGEWHVGYCRDGRIFTAEGIKLIPLIRIPKEEWELSADEIIQKHRVEIIVRLAM